MTRHIDTNHELALRSALWRRGLRFWETLALLVFAWLFPEATMIAVDVTCAGALRRLEVTQ